jgi:hypothetical protein
MTTNATSPTMLANHAAWWTPTPTNIAARTNAPKITGDSAVPTPSMASAEKRDRDMTATPGSTPTTKKTAGMRAMGDEIKSTTKTTPAIAARWNLRSIESVIR